MMSEGEARTQGEAAEGTGGDPVPGNDHGSNDHNNSVEWATYPLPPPLVSILSAATAETAETAETAADTADAATDANNFDVQREDPPNGLQCLVANAVAAIDLLYFATPSRIRQDQECFGHRSCLRVVANQDDQTLTITDLGVGMTRADLINCLGIGRNIAVKGPGKGAPSRASSVLTTDESDSSGSADDDDEDDDSEDIFNEANAKAEQDAAHMGGRESITVDARKTSLGGFYAAVCSLGTAVKVGTKSKFDDYYEFQVGTFDSDQVNISSKGANGPTVPEESTSPFGHFILKRPFPEGTKLTPDIGFDKLEHIRGDSGSMVCIQVRNDLTNTLLDYTWLHDAFEKILETTHTSVVLGNSDQSAELIAATAREEQRKEEILQSIDEDDDLDVGDPAQDNPDRAAALDKLYSSMKERAKYIPLRLSLNERKMLRLVEASMTCCDYTSEVDGAVFKNAMRRKHKQLKLISSVFRGLVTACDYDAGKQLADDMASLSSYQTFLQEMMEFARRHKIRNPEKMRTEYGKLIYLLQDASQNQEHLELDILRPIESVYRYLEERNGLGVLEDPAIETATEEILAGRKSRSAIDAEIRRKEKAVQMLKKKYRNPKLSSDDIHLCLYSICDNNSFLNSNRVPIDKVIDFLKTHFHPDEIEEGYSLAIVSGEAGARLSHSHERQYYFALQSLTLWRDIIDDMFRLWAMAENDLLNQSIQYSLQDTGQGMQRVQQSPETYKAMQKILIRVQAKVKHWVGSSVIHLGDHNVPNALSFIDKYTQVPRILGPIVACLENAEKLCEEDDGIKAFIDNGFGGIEKLRMDILYDFFRSAFDGSGADNFYDAGSCIDGRLTSAWNWCSNLPDKSFYPIFQLTGFVGFDGEFK